MSPGPTFERVYGALKERIRHRSFRPGEHIDPSALGEELSTSITPVRDALHRLVGERLVEAPRPEGFRAPLLTEIGLRHLYGWHLDVLLLALRSAPPSGQVETMCLENRSTAPVALAAATEAAFLEIARRSANPEHAIMIGNIGDRLHAIRLIEPLLLEDVGIELGELIRLSSAGEVRALRRAIIRYHRRRNRVAAHLIEALHHSPIAPADTSTAARPR